MLPFHSLSHSSSTKNNHFKEREKFKKFYIYSQSQYFDFYKNCLLNRKLHLQQNSYYTKKGEGNISNIYKNNESSSNFELGWIVREETKKKKKFHYKVKVSWLQPGKCKAKL